MYRRGLLVLGSLVLGLLGLVGCGGGPIAPDAGDDVAPDGGADATVTGGVCGDGVVDDGEECDDGNDDAFDGCEPVMCTFTCKTDERCDDENPCTGVETCDLSTHACEPGAAPAEGDACPRGEDPDGVCRAGVCVDAGCGNNVVDGDDQCDDGNAVNGDGCETDCTFSCTSDEDCATATVCDGDHTCDLATHTCQGTGDLDCDDESPCTVDSCHDVDGCVHALVDGDGDGHASSDLGACGDDCDDGDATIYAGAPELCEAAAPFIDNDCDPSTPNPSASLWYLDCDEDSFSTTTAASTMSCEAPAPQSGCGWTSRIPITGDPSTVDCNDARADMFPGQTMYFTSPHPCSGCSGNDRFADYNCDDTVNKQVATTPFNVSSTASCSLTSPRLGFVSCTGAYGWTSTTEPTCGHTGTYTRCDRAPDECIPRTSGDCRGYFAVCVGDARVGAPCYCPPRTICEPDCVPGTRDCPWHYYRCRRTATSSTVGCR